MTIRGRVYVLGDNIDTDQIIPAQYLTLVPTIPEEYEKLGSYALIGLPDDRYPIDLVEPGHTKSQYQIVIGGRNFGCGSSREHAPIAMGAAGSEVAIHSATIALMNNDLRRLPFLVKLSRSTRTVRSTGHAPSRARRIP